MNISEKIKNLRTKNNLTQEQLAEKLQVSRSTISSWETGRSFPDLEMVIEICDCFNVSLDFLLREDEKLVSKLNFGIREKRILIGLVIILSVLFANTIISAIPFKANPKSLEVSNVHMIRDVSYNGEDPFRDWNTTIDLNLKSKNIFFKPIGDDMLVSNENGNITIHTNWNFSLFHIFDMHRYVRANQSILIDENISNDEITLELEGNPNNLIPFEINNINSK